MKTDLFCYSFNHLWIIIFALAAILVAYIIPETEFLIPDILIKSSVVSIIFIALILQFNISAELNSLFYKTLKMIKNTLKL